MKRFLLIFFSVLTVLSQITGCSMVESQEKIADKEENYREATKEEYKEYAKMEEEKHANR